MAIFAIFIDFKTVSCAYDGIQAVSLFLSKYKPICNDIFQEVSCYSFESLKEIC